MCDMCHFKCNKKHNYDTHLLTAKHILRTNTSETKLKKATEYSCDCGKKYKHASSLCNHKNKCLIISNPIKDTSNNFVIDKEFVMSILKQNADIMKENGELTNLMMEVVKTKQLLASSASNNPIEKDIISFK